MLIVINFDISERDEYIRCSKHWQSRGSQRDQRRIEFPFLILGRNALPFIIPPPRN